MAGRMNSIENLVNDTNLKVALTIISWESKNRYILNIIASIGFVFKISMKRPPIIHFHLI